MTTTPDLQRAADLLSEVFELLILSAIQAHYSQITQPDDYICTAPEDKRDDCNEMDTTADFLP